MVYGSFCIITSFKVVQKEAVVITHIFRKADDLLIFKRRFLIVVNIKTSKIHRLNSVVSGVVEYNLLRLHAIAKQTIK
ncbi:MAG: hypothetical protein COB00_17460 [Alcanivorax sp.]|nr:MAG: hypothetical protein COB00_17460 [Alcanivorax sp.]